MGCVPLLFYLKAHMIVCSSVPFAVVPLVFLASPCRFLFRSCQVETSIGVCLDLSVAVVSLLPTKGDPAVPQISTPAFFLPFLVFLLPRCVSHHGSFSPPPRTFLINAASCCVTSRYVALPHSWPCFHSASRLAMCRGLVCVDSILFLPWWLPSGLPAGNGARFFVTHAPLDVSFPACFVPQTTGRLCCTDARWPPLGGIPSPLIV